MTFFLGCAIAYIAILYIFYKFGKFLKSCDEQANEMMHEKFVHEVESNGDQNDATRNSNFTGGSDRNSNLFVQRLENTGL